MGKIEEAFVAAMGRPDPACPDGLQLADWLQYSWQRIHAGIGAGWFRSGFLYLFGPGLTELGACLEAWRFLVPPNSDRTILGRNAYGAILVLDDASDPERQRVRVLDPWTVTYAGTENLNFKSLIARALPGGELADFLDDSAYRQWCEEHALERIDVDDVLGVKVPKPLGGRLVGSNLQLDGIVDYYQTTGPIYAEALSKTRPP